MSTDKKSIILGRLNSPRVMIPTESAYWAATVDGEGSIMITTARLKDQRRQQYRALINITNTDFHYLDVLAKMVGVGTLQKNNRTHSAWKDRGQLVLNHEAADFVLRQIRPYLIIKGEQADIAMQFMELKRAWSRSNDNWVEQSALCERMKALNARGKANQKEYSFGLDQKPQPRTCDHDGCNEKHYGNGFCRRHYRWALGSRVWTGGVDRRCQECSSALEVSVPINTKFCSVSCKMKFHRREGCYSPETAHGARVCEFEGCDRRHHSKGLCRRHYMQQWHAANMRQ